MAEAKIELKDGTIITVSGSAEEVARIAILYGSAPQSDPGSKRDSRPKTPPKSRSDGDSLQEVNLPAIANTIKDCDESEQLEDFVLDKQDNTRRILMCLYINEKYLNSKPALTTGEISKILSQLGIPVSTPVISVAISRNAQSYVMQDSIRKKGAIVRYSINRKGKKYFEEVLEGKNNTAEKPARRPRAKIKKSEEVSKEKQTNSPTKVKRTPAYKPRYNTALDLHDLNHFTAKHPTDKNSEHVIVFTKFLSDEIHHDPISGDDIYTCFSELKSKIPLPGSFMNTLRNAQNRDHLITYEKGFTKIELTAKGENLFNHDIIKREK